jgi:hypothetical protein
MFVQFTNDKNTEIQSAFGGPQDPDAYPNQGEIEDSDPRYITFIESMTPSVTELAKAERDHLLQLAAIRIAPLQDAADLEEATTVEATLLKKWKQYRIALNRLRLEVQPVLWPDPPA